MGQKQRSHRSGWLCVDQPDRQASDCRQPLAAFRTTTLDHEAAVFGRHARPKAMRAGAVQVAWLESTFGRHDTKP